MIIDQ
ncbi:hypothetical protein YPPY59_2015, partial [Yersinia pestis PY-59]